MIAVLTENLMNCNLQCSVSSSNGAIHGRLIWEVAARQNLDDPNPIKHVTARLAEHIPLTPLQVFRPGKQRVFGRASATSIQLMDGTMFTLSPIIFLFHITASKRS